MDAFFVKPGTNKRQRPESRFNNSTRPSFDQSSGRGGRGRGGNSQRGSRGRGSRGSSRGGRPTNGVFPDHTTNGNTKKRFRPEEEEIVSDESGLEDAEDEMLLRREAEVESDAEETEQEKRLRLTKDYLQQLADVTGDEKDVGDVLRDEVLDQAGRLRRPVAAQFNGVEEDAVKTFRGHSGHKLAVACVASNGSVIFSGGKEGVLIKWDILSGKMLKKIPLDKTGTVGHSDAILCLTLSSDSKFVASGSGDKMIKVWNVLDVSLFCLFKGHRGSVSGVVFRFNSHELFSCGFDRNVKVWNVDEKAYVETLFGHQNEVCAVDSFYKERCVTAGGQDSSVRIWKILEESQLVFQLPSGSLECLSLVDDEHFVTGADDGSVALWGAHKKKPIYTVKRAHTATLTGEPCWVAAVEAVKNSDLFASGSHSGEIKIWMIKEGFAGILPHFTIPLVGFVNSLKFVGEGSVLIAGVGQEHRMGRWWRLKEAKNAVCLFPLKRVAPLLHSDSEADR